MLSAEIYTCNILGIDTSSGVDFV